MFWLNCDTRGFLDDFFSSFVFSSLNSLPLPGLVTLLLGSVSVCHWKLLITVFSGADVKVSQQKHRRFCLTARLTATLDSGLLVSRSTSTTSTVPILLKLLKCFPPRFHSLKNFPTSETPPRCEQSLMLCSYATTQIDTITVCARDVRRLSSMRIPMYFHAAGKARRSMTTWRLGNGGSKSLRPRKQTRGCYFLLLRRDGIFGARCSHFPRGSLQGLLFFVFFCCRRRLQSELNEKPFDFPSKESGAEEATVSYAEEKVGFLQRGRLK